MKELIDAQKAQKSHKNYGFLMFKTCEFQLKVIPKLWGKQPKILNS